MNLSINNFSKSNATFSKNGEEVKAKVFTYETSKALYDVYIFENGEKFHRINMGVLSALKSDFTKIHEAIINHFKIEYKI